MDLIKLKTRTPKWKEGAFNNAILWMNGDEADLMREGMGDRLEVDQIMESSLIQITEVLETKVSFN